MAERFDVPPTVGIVGAGRVGSVLGAALQRAGWPVAALSAASTASLQRARNLLPDVAVEEPSAVARMCQLLLLAVPDDALADRASVLTEAGAVTAGQYVVHTSGAHGVRALSAVRDVGGRVVAMHPVMTFTGTAVDLARLPGCTYGVTCADGDLAMATRVVRALDGRLERIAEADRPLYHAALAHGSNHLVTLVAEAMDLLGRAGVGEPAAALRPLLTAALDNTLAAGDVALTGPVARGDAGTVRSHLERLGQVAPAQRASYAAMARATVRRAVAANRLSSASGAAITAVLDDLEGKATA